MRVSGGSFISLSMIELFRSAKPVAPGAIVPPTVPLKMTSAVRQSVSSIFRAVWSAQWPGVWIGLDPQLARLDHVALGERLGDDAVAQRLRGQLVRGERHAVALGQLLGPDHVVPVVVGEQHVGDLGALAVDPLGQRLGHLV